MNMKKTTIKHRVLAICSAAVACTLLFSGCSTGGTSSSSSSAPTASVDLTSGPEVDLTFWHSMGGTNANALQTMVDDFNNQHAGHIKVTAQYQGSYDDAINKFKSAMVAKSGPDIMQSYELGTRYLIDSGFIEPMQDFINKDKWDVKQIDANIAAYYTVQGKLYSMPFNSSTPILYYNKDMFKEAGLDPANPPKTFEEIINDAPKLTKKDASGNVTQSALGMYVYGWFLDQSLNKMGKPSFDNGNGRTKAPTKIVFDTNGGGKTFLDMYQQLLKTGTMPAYAMKDADGQAAFVNGKLAMYINSTAGLAGLLKAINGKFDLGTAYYPAIDSKSVNGGVSIGGASLWMTKNSDARVMEAKWEFIKFMASAKEQAYWNTQTGYFPINVGAYNEQTFKDNVKKYPQFQTAIDQLHASSKSSVGGLCAIYTQVRKIEETEMQKMLNNQQSSDEALKNMASQIDGAMQDYNDANVK